MRERFGVVLFVLATTFLWIIPPFAMPLDQAPLSAAAHYLGVVTIVAFGVAAWGLARGSAWWLVATRAAGALGLLTCGVVVALDVEADLLDVRLVDPAAHAVGCLGILVLASVPPWRAALARRLTWLGGRRRT